MREWVKIALAEGFINSADTAFADLMQTLATKRSESLWCASVLASAAIQNGDVCVMLSQVAATAKIDNTKTLQTDLQASGVVQQPELSVSLPLVLDHAGRLYLSRYWHAERDLAEVLQAFLQHDAEDTSSLLPIDLLDQLFPPQVLVKDSEESHTSQAQQTLANSTKARTSKAKKAQLELPLEPFSEQSPEQLSKQPLAETSGPDWQRVATVVAARQRLCVITGGPGTGKTRTVARLLTVLQAQLKQAPRIALLAPTGKAAARLLESLRNEVGQLQQQGLPLELPDTASTLHRALGYQPGRPGFRHNAGFPLPFDIVLVDEASMVDLTLMHSLVTALADDTRLILLGDRDQLASVEAGNVLGDIVGDASPARYSAAQRQALIHSCDGFDEVDMQAPAAGLSEAQTPEPLVSVAQNSDNEKQNKQAQGTMADAVVELQHSYRFDAKSGIGRFAKAVNAGDANAARAVGNDTTLSDLQFVNPDTVSLQNHLLANAVPATINVIESSNVEKALKESLAYRVLCALHKGPRGVDQINRLIESRLVRLGHSQPNQLWYQGRPILITRNDPGTGLYNGDTGLIWPDASGNMMAWFPDGEDTVRAVAPGRLPAHQTCFAMTVHKTQGSEFTKVLLVLPEPPHPLLSRDLLYTGITRARKEAEIYASEEGVDVACETKRVRASGLRERLWG